MQAFVLVAALAALVPATAAAGPVDTPGFTSFLKDGTILTSTNGVNWVLRPSGATNGLRGIAYGNARFVAVGDTGTAPADSATID